MYTLVLWDQELKMAQGTSNQCVRQMPRDGVHLERDSVSPEGTTGLGGIAKALSTTQSDPSFDTVSLQQPFPRSPRQMIDNCRGLVTWLPRKQNHQGRY